MRPCEPEQRAVDGKAETLFHESVKPGVALAQGEVDRFFESHAIDDLALQVTRQKLWLYAGLGGANHRAAAGRRDRATSSPSITAPARTSIGMMSAPMLCWLLSSAASARRESTSTSQSNT